MQKVKGILEQSGLVTKMMVFVGIICFFIVLIAPLLSIFSNSQFSEADVLRLTQIGMSLALFILPVLLFAYLFSKNPISYLQLDVKIQWKSAGLLTIFMFLIIPFVNLLSLFNQQLVLPESMAAIESWMKASEADVAQLTQKILITNSFAGLVISLFIVALLPAVGEELFCRGVLQRIFQDWKGAHVAIWLTAIIFSSIHLQFYGFLPRLLFGAFFGYLLLWSGSLWLPILAHLVNNAIAVIFNHLSKNGYQLIDLDTIGTHQTLWLGMLSGVVAIVGVIFLKKQLSSPALPRE